MNITDKIDRLLNSGVGKIVIFQDPEKGLKIIQAEQSVATGPNFTRANVVHQACDASLLNALNTIERQVEKIAELETKIVQIRRNDN